MKKFRLFFKGSPKELQFIDKWKQQGYFLTSINHSVYTFEENSVVENAVLAVEYIDQETPMNPEENPALIHSLQKQLFLKKFHIVYNYYESDKEYYILSDTFETQIKYLEKLKNRILLFSNLFTFMCALSWTAVNILGVLCVFLMLLAPVSWITYGLLASKINMRISDAGKLAGLLEVDIHPPVTVVIKNLKEKPIIDDLAYLGTWKFVTSKKDDHYFKLTTNFSEEQVKSDISSFFNIDPEDIIIVASFGLAPIGYFS